MRGHTARAQHGDEQVGEQDALGVGGALRRCGATVPAYSHSSMAMAVKPMDSTQNSEMEKV